MSNDIFIAIFQCVGFIVVMLLGIVGVAIFVVATWDIYKHEFHMDWEHMEERILKLETIIMLKNRK